MSLNRLYTLSMKRVSFALLVILAFTVLAPMAMFTFPAIDNGNTFLGTLDVCRTATPALSTGGEMICIGACVYRPVPALVVSVQKPCAQLFVELILSSRNEQPPRTA
jgi:hypothetical protein